MSNNLAPLSAAVQAQELVGQEEALRRLRDAIYPADRTFRLLFVRAEGGMGKTRLLEEVSARVQGEWAELGDSAVSGLVDVIDMRLHERSQFIKEMRDQFPHPEEFRQYEHALDEVTLLSASGAQLNQLKAVQQKAIDAFLEDLKEITQKKRVVWLVDTVEQLSYVTSEWLIENELLTEDDLRERTHQWLIDLIKHKELDNVTLVLAGRGKEGKTFFESMRAAYKKAVEEGLARKLDDIEIQPLSRDEIRTYFAQLAKDREAWQEDNPINTRIIRQFNYLADEKNERADVLWLYTGGIPVRLALYAQIIVEGHEIPKELRYSFETAVAQAGTDNPQKPTEALHKIQWNIEDQFIYVLFRDPTDLQARILRHLVRASRGLNAEQLHFLLDNHEKVPIKQWRPDPKRLQELTQALKGMESLYLVKRRSALANLRPVFEAENKSEAELEAATYRLGLQDEIYRIYAEHMAPHKDPVEEHIRVIWESLPDEEKSRYEENWKYERNARQKMYAALSEWAAYFHDEYLAKKKAYMFADERKLELQLRPEQPRTFYFEQLGTIEVARRLAINEAMITFEIEEMVYHLLRDPEKNINENYIDIGTNNNKANQGNADFWAQAEMWRITHDDYSLKFVTFSDRKSAQGFGETMVDVLHRAVQQEDVSRWIKRFVLRNEYARAIELADKVDEVIAEMPRKTKLERRVWWSWRHSLVVAERRIWACYARIFLSEEMPATLKELHFHIDRLEMLRTKNVNQSVFQVEEEYWEKGFAADLENDEPAHPAFVRVKRLLSLAYDVLGYGYATLGQVRQAVKYYGRSLYVIRGDKGVDSHRGYVLNDLSKALSDMGRTSITVCVDGLNLRRKLAEEVPLAVSYNTLALIYDDMDRYEEAPELVAKAIAYLRRAGAQRWLGLALIQLGESLRHLAIRANRGELAQATPDGLYAASEILLREAKTIFSTDVKEVSRLIITLIEMGSLYRDRLRPTKEQREEGPAKSKQINQAHYREALVNLNEAIRLAKEKQLNHLLIDAYINLAWTHFHAGKLGKVKEVFRQVKDIVDSRYFIQPVSKDRTAYVPDRNDEKLVDLFWAMRQLSKLETVHGQMGLRLFEERVNQLKEEIPNEEARHKAVQQDAEAQDHLKEAAEAYILALGYANILSPGSRMFDYLLDDFYYLLRKFNHTELDSFHDHVQNFGQKYPHLESIKILDQFLHEFFGLPEDEEEIFAEA